MDLIGKIVELKKIKDKVFNGKHPNGVFVGNTLFGFCMENPDVGKPLILFIGAEPSGWTSNIEKIDDENMTIETINSIYKVGFVEVRKRTFDKYNK